MAENSFLKSLKRSKSSKQLIAGSGDGIKGMTFSLSFSESVFKLSTYLRFALKCILRCKGIVNDYNWEFSFHRSKVDSKNLLTGSKLQSVDLQTQMYSIQPCLLVLNNRTSQADITGAIQADFDIKAINIILQGLPTEIHSTVKSTSGELTSFAAVLQGITLQDPGQVEAILKTEDGFICYKLQREGHNVQYRHPNQKRKMDDS
ncbi:hypothetical protein Tco_0091905 [Tanacetum coccineum]